eukprot:gene5209-14959_t
MPYGLGMSFFKTLGDNMVLQRAPARSAVYGIVGLASDGSHADAKVSVTVMDEHGASYDVAADMDTVQQPRPPQYNFAEEPLYVTWKAFLRPTAMGGNYTIVAKCAQCADQYHDT